MARLLIFSQTFGLARPPSYARRAAARKGGMVDFSFTCRDGDDVIVEPRAAGVVSEAEAIDWGRLLAQNHQQVEVWSGARLVHRFQDGQDAAQ